MNNIKIKILLIVAVLFTLLMGTNRITTYADTLDLDVASINITTVDNNGNSIVKSDGYVSIDTIVINNEDGSQNVQRVQQGDQIKVRGNSTADGEKKPFNIKFSKKTEVLGMTKNKKWCLLANCFDPTLLRNYIAFKLAEDMGLTVPDCRIVQLTLDGVNKGCYLLTEATENTADIDTDSGEFFLEIESSKNEPETTYFVSAGLRFVADDPEYEDLEDSEFQYNGETYKAYIQDTLDNLMNILDQDDYSKVQENFDVEALAKYYLLDEYYKVVDVGFSSTNFVYRNNKLTAGPVWDYDLSSGNANEDYYATSGYFGYTGDSSTTLWANQSLFSKLLKYSEFKDLVCTYYSQYKDTFENYYEDNGVIDQTITQYEKVINNNFSNESTGAKWDISFLYAGLMKSPETTYDQNIIFYKNWLKNRNEWLSSFFRHCLDNDHTYTETVTKSAACGVDGEKTLTCACGASTTEVIPAIGEHTWGEPVITKEATENQEGEKTYTCSTCGATKTEATVTGLVKSEGKWYYVKDDVYDPTYTGMAKNQWGWWYVKEGTIDFTYTGMAKNQYGWWYMKNGKLDLTYTGLARNQYGWWYMKNGKLDQTYTGMAKNQYGWWYVTKGKLNSTYTGLGKNAYGTWYFKNGKLMTGFSGKVKIGTKTYKIKNGKVVS